MVNNNLKALIAHGSFPKLHIDLISRDATGQELVDELIHWAKKHHKENVSVRSIEIAELDYQTTPASSQQAFILYAEQLATQILNPLNLTGCSEASPYILNPHNGNLGKNPAVTLALKLLAKRIEQENHPIRILYQMHDFAEDHRPQCWSALRNCTGQDDKEFAVEMMYPPHRCVNWVTINSADKTKLESIGLDARNISLLPNAVEIETFTQPTLLEQPKHKLDLQNRIAAYATQNGYTFDPNRKTILSPIKIIRRKNVIESILLLLKLNADTDHYQLLLTLNANSPEDIDYGEAIAALIKEFHLPVIIGYGHELAGPTAKIKNDQVQAFGLIDLMAMSDAIITTSIQEGFGYVFHEPWLAHKAVLGRNINMVTSDFTTQGMKLDHLYEHLLIPQQWLGDQWKIMVEAYHQKITQLRQEAGLSPLILDIERAKLFQSPDCPEAMIDFADCDQTVQLHIIKEVTNGNLDINQIIAVNKALQKQTDWYRPDDSDRIAHNRQVVINRYGLKAQAKQLQHLLELKPNDSIFPENKKKTNQPVFEQALAPENNRLLI